MSLKPLPKKKAMRRRGSSNLLNACYDNSPLQFSHVFLDTDLKYPLTAIPFQFETEHTKTTLFVPEHSIAHLLLEQYANTKIHQLKQQLTEALKTSYHYQLKQLGSIAKDYDYYHEGWPFFIQDSLPKLPEANRQALLRQQKSLYEVLSYHVEREYHPEKSHVPALPHPDYDTFYRYPLITLFEKVLDLFTLSPYRNAYVPEVIYALMKHALAHSQQYKPTLSEHFVCNILLRTRQTNEQRPPYHGQTFSSWKHFRRAKKQVQALINHEYTVEKAVEAPALSSGRWSNAKAWLKGAIVSIIPTGIFARHVRPINCHSDEFTCTSKDECLKSNRVCDGQRDCSDWSDETVDACKKHCGNARFSCKEISQCIDANRKCDTFHDCIDGSDETNCATCQEGMTKCPDKSHCMTNEQFCDGVENCDDGSDESPTVCERRFMQQVDALQFCPKGTPGPRCLEETRRVLCDGEYRPTTEQVMQRFGFEKKACQDLTTRTNYGTHACCLFDYDTTTYDSVHTNQCIDGVNVCDGKDDGITGQLDEQPQLCHDPRFHQATVTKCFLRCAGTGTCIPESKMCDGKKDCRFHGEDELSPHCVTNDNNVYLNKACRSDPTAFHCGGGGHCVSKVLMCDGHANCPNHADEIGMHCTRHTIDIYLHQACGNEPATNTSACHERVRQDACNLLPARNHGAEASAPTPTPESTTPEISPLDASSGMANKMSFAPTMTQIEHSPSLPVQQRVTEQTVHAEGYSFSATLGIAIPVSAVIGGIVTGGACYIHFRRFKKAFPDYEHQKLGKASTVAEDNTEMEEGIVEAAGFSVTNQRN